MLKRLLRLFWENKLVCLVILLGSLGWSLTMIRSGLSYEYGVGFWGPNGHDGIWHIALAESLAKGSINMPTFAGHSLQNYHLGFDLLLVLLNKLTGLSISNLYFQVVPPVMALLIGLIVYKFVLIWRRSEKEALWSTFFVYFGGSLGWLIGKGESAFWSQQAISTLVNPPYALSVAVLLCGFVAIVENFKKPALIKKVFFVIAFGSLIQIKAYAGILVLGGFLVAAVYDFWKRKSLKVLGLWFWILIISMILFVPFNKNSPNLLLFKPFWFLETMMQSTDRVGWIRFGEAMTAYRNGNVFWKAIPAYFIAFLIFWYGNIGIRLIGEFTIAKWIRNYKEATFIEIFILTVVLGGVTIPTLFLQKGTPWNTIQFFYYSLFFMAILAGIGVAGILEIIKNKNVRAFMMFGVILFSVPTSFITLKNNYLTSRPPAKLSTFEKEALDFLAMEPEGVVLTYPFDEIQAKKAEENPPRPLYQYVSTAYVSAYSKKPVFLEDEMNLNITNYNWEERRNEIEKFYKSLDREFVWKFLRDNDITYIYWVKPQRATLGETQLGIERIFENSEVDIYKLKN